MYYIPTTTSDNSLRVNEKMNEGKLSRKGHDILWNRKDESEDGAYVLEEQKYIK